jgi:hypothetical protein
MTVTVQSHLFLALHKGVEVKSLGLRLKTQSSNFSSRSAARPEKIHSE